MTANIPAFTIPPSATHDTRLHDLGVGTDWNDLQIQFFINLRPDLVHEKNIRGITYLSAKGLEKLFIGFGAGNNEDLRLYNKHCTVDEQEKIPNFINIVCMQE